MKTLVTHSLIGLTLSVHLLACRPTTPQATSQTKDQGELALSIAKAKLGKAIFHDTSLSEPAGLACASCHEPALGFTGNNKSTIPAVALGSRPENFGSRNAPSAAYASFSPAFAFVTETDEDGKIDIFAQGGQFWDGRAANLAEQAKGPFLNPKEMNNPSPATVVAKVASSSYAELFRSVYGATALSESKRAYELIADAIAAYESSSTVNRFDSKFDAFLRGEESLSLEESKGFALFKDPEKGNCIACHTGNTESEDPQEWLFTDFTYDNLGVPRNSKIPQNQNPEFFDLGLCQQPGLKAPEGFDIAATCGQFKVPTLRNVAKSAPYMHNGVFDNLRDVVKFYVTRDTHPELWYPKNAQGELQIFNDLPLAYHPNVNRDEAPYDRKRGEEPRLDEEEIDAVVAFLKTLSDR